MKHEKTFQKVRKLIDERELDDALRVLKLNFPKSAYIAGNGPVQDKAWWKLW